MKILIINLPRFNGFSVTREGRCEFYTKYRVDTPINLLIIASILRENSHEITFLDANGFNLNYKQISNEIKEKKYQCIIFSFNSKIIDYDLKFCDFIKLKYPSCLTIGFSWYANNFSKEILNEYLNLDIQIIGDPLKIIENLINSLESNKKLINIKGIAYRNEKNNIVINTAPPSEKNFNKMPAPAYDLLPSFKPYFIFSKYFSPYVLIYSGKGCSFSCQYCIVANTVYSYKSAEKIIHELKILKKIGNIKFVWFFDEVFTLNKKRVIKICQGIIRNKLNIKWFCDTRVNLVDEKLLRIMRQAGCIGIAYGVESGSQKILNSMNKGISVEQAKKALFWTRKANILIQLNLILGYVGENNKSLEETKKFIKSVLPINLQIGTITAKEGTEFTKLALKNGWVDSNLHWKEKLKSYPINIYSYKPFKYNLKEMRHQMYKICYFNPKWWLYSLRTMIFNYKLILPGIEILFKKVFIKKNLFYNIF